MQQSPESLKKSISELEDSFEKGKKSNSSLRKTLNADKEEITNEMYYTYIIVQRTSLYLTLSYNLLHYSNKQILLFNPLSELVGGK